MSDGVTSYTPMHTNETELIPLTHQQTEEANYTCENSMNWGDAPCNPCENEEWKIPFAVGKSRYLACHLGHPLKHTKEQVYDILEVPIEIEQESDYAKYADQIIDILHKPHQHKWSNMKWNFDSSIKYMNLILYVPDFFEHISCKDVMIPKTALPILGNTLHELINRTKAWLFSSGEFTPICNTIGEGVYKTTLQEKSLVKGLKKRLEMTGLVSRLVEEVTEPFIKKESSRFLLDENYSSSFSQSLSPFSNLHIVIKHCVRYENFIEKLLYSIAVALKLPSLKMTPRINENNELIGFDIDFLDPYKAHLHSTSTFYSLSLVQSDLFREILSKADEFFYRNDNLYTGWNIVTMAIFLNKHKKVQRAVVKSDFATITDEAQIERIFRYSLVYGSTRVIKAIFENETLSKLLKTRTEKILNLTFQKSANEVFLYNRLMKSLGIVDEMGNTKKKFTYLDLVKTAIQHLISHGLLWTPCVKMFENEEVDHVFAFFPEYIMVWGVLSQRFDVIELFLSYSGLHRQYISSEDYNLSTQKGVYHICNALAMAAMLKGVAKKLKNDISITSADFDNLIKHSKRFDSIATELLDYALTTDEFTPRTLLNTPSPFWSNNSALDLAYIGKAYTFLNHNAVQVYLQHVWSGYDSVKQIEGERVHIHDRMVKILLRPFKPSSIRFLYLVLNTARTGYFFHGIFFLFLIACFIAVLTGSPPAENDTYPVPVEWILFICLLGFTVEEMNQYFSSVFKKLYQAGFAEWRIVLKLASYNYFDSIWNKLDVIIVLMFIISFVTRTISVFYLDFPFDILRLIYGISAIPVFIRSFQHILVVKAIGPLIYTIYQAFLKMLKFLIIIFILSAAVGTLQVALLSPTTSKSIRFRHLIFTPFFQIFGEYFFDDLQSHTYQLIPCNASVLSCNSLSGIFWERSDFILYFVVAVWVLIINVLILNLMIAYFTRIYDEVAADAKSIYIWQFIEIVKEFESRIIFPPPLNLVLYPVEFIIYLIKLKLRQSKKNMFDNKLLEMVNEREKTSNKFNVYFATHYENSFADKYWRNKYATC